MIEVNPAKLFRRRMVDMDGVEVTSVATTGFDDKGKGKVPKKGEKGKDGPPAHLARKVGDLETPRYDQGQRSSTGGIACCAAPPRGVKP